MAEQQLDRAHIDAGFEQVNGEGVPQTVRRDGFENTAKPVRLLARQLHGFPADVPARKVAWEEPMFGFFQSPPLAQDFPQLRREHHVAVLLALSLIDPNDHARAINIGNGEGNRFGDAQASGVARCQDGAMLSCADTAEKLEDFLRAQNNG